MDGLYANVRIEPKTRRDTWIWVIMAALGVLFAGVIVSTVWFLGYHGRFTKFVGNLSASTTYAYNNDSLTATIDGKTFRVSDDNMYGLFGYLSLNNSGRESGKVPEGEPVTLDYGDGSMLELWDIPAEGGRHYMFVQYTDIDGGIYSYISYKTTLDTVVVRYLTYGNDEIDGV